MIDYLIESLKHLNWLAVLVAAFAGFSLGALWYSPLLFVKAWIEESKVNVEEAKKKSMALTMGTAFLLQFIAAALIATLIGVVWISTSMGIHYLFEGKSLKLFFINAGYSIVSYTIMGVILGAWH
jgi:Protein of unknown function (DUF1761)